MGAAIGASLPMALGVAISAIPIIAVILMLLSRRAHADALAFTAAWTLSIAVALVVVVFVAGTQDLQTSSGTADGVSWVRVGIGVLLLGLARRQWRSRPKPGEEPQMPKWLSAVDSLTPLKAAGLAAALAVANPKNLLLLVAGGLAIAGASTSGADRAVAVIVFVVIAASTVVAPVVAYFVMGDRAQPVLDEIKAWLVAHNAAVMTVLFLVLGVVVLGNGIGGF